MPTLLDPPFKPSFKDWTSTGDITVTASAAKSSSTTRSIRINTSTIAGRGRVRAMQKQLAGEFAERMAWMKAAAEIENAT